jgi:hypothetical protein
MMTEDRIKQLQREIRERQVELASLAGDTQDVTRMSLDLMTEEQHRACGCAACIRWLEERS